MRFRTLGKKYYYVFLSPMLRRVTIVLCGVLFYIMLSKYML